MRSCPRLLLLASLGGPLAGLPGLLWPQDDIPQRPAPQAPQATAITGDLPIGPDRPRGPLFGACTPQALLAWSGSGGLDILGGPFPVAVRTLTLTNTGTQPSLLPCPRHLDPGNASEVLVEADDAVPAQARLDG